MQKEQLPSKSATLSAIQSTNATGIIRSFEQMQKRRKLWISLLSYAKRRKNKGGFETRAILIIILGVAGRVVIENWTPLMIYSEAESVVELNVIFRIETCKS